MASINKRNGKWSVRVSFYDKFGKRHFKNKEGFNRKKRLKHGPMKLNKVNLMNPLVKLSHMLPFPTII